MSIRDYLIEVYYSSEDEAFIARVPDLPGCVADGASPEEAIKEVQVALEGIIEARMANNMPIPEPSKICAS